MAVAASVSDGHVDALKKWISREGIELQNSIHGLGDSLPPSLLGFELRITLGSLIQLHNEFAQNNPLVPPAQPFLMQDVWSLLVQSVSTTLSKKFILAFMRKCLSSGSTTNPVNNHDSRGNHSVSCGHCPTPGQVPPDEMIEDCVIDIKEELDVGQMETFPTEYSSEAAGSSEESRDSSDEEVRGPPSRKKHRYRLTKSVPAAFAYSFRGVQCQHCFNAYRGLKCVDELVNHTKQRHKEHATPDLLKKLRAKNTPQKVIGAGMRYCECPSCLSRHRADGYLC